MNPLYSSKFFFLVTTVIPKSSTCSNYIGNTFWLKCSTFMYFPFSFLIAFCWVVLILPCCNFVWCFFHPFVHIENKCSFKILLGESLTVMIYSLRPWGTLLLVSKSDFLTCVCNFKFTGLNRFQNYSSHLNLYSISSHSLKTQIHQFFSFFLGLYHYIFIYSIIKSSTKFSFVHGYSCLCAASFTHCTLIWNQPTHPIFKLILESWSCFEILLNFSTSSASAILLVSSCCFSS